MLYGIIPVIIEVVVLRTPTIKVESKDDVIKSLEKARPFQGNRTKLFHTSFKIPRIKKQKGCFILFKYIEKMESGFVRLDFPRFSRHQICYH